MVRVSRVVETAVPDPVRIFSYMVEDRSDCAVELTVIRAPVATPGAIIRVNPLEPKPRFLALDVPYRGVWYRLLLYDLDVLHLRDMSNDLAKTAFSLWSWAEHGLWNGPEDETKVVYATISVEQFRTYLMARRLQGLGRSRHNLPAALRRNLGSSGPRHFPALVEAKLFRRLANRRTRVVNNAIISIVNFQSLAALKRADRLVGRRA